MWRLVAVSVRDRGRGPQREARWIYELLTAKESDDLYDVLLRLPLDVSAPWDDRPFFFYQERLARPRDLTDALRGQKRAHLLGGGLTILLRVGLALALLVSLFLLTPTVARLFTRRPRDSSTSEGFATRARDVVYVDTLFPIFRSGDSIFGPAYHRRTQGEDMLDICGPFASDFPGLHLVLTVHVCIYKTDG